MTFLAPIFLAGIALLAIPWLIHHIRRPPRTPVRFSSLMFLPQVKKEVIERRRIQHWLLMLLRMLLVFLLAFAFSRPFRKTSEQVVVGGREPGRQVILLDTSYSMGLGPGFETARKTALAVLADIPDQVPVAVITFARAPKLISGFEDGGRASHDRAGHALAEVGLTQDITDYAAALQFAENLLLAAAPVDEDETEEIGVLHMISDFRKQGLPNDRAPWRLSGKIRFVGHELNAVDSVNLSLTDIAVQPLEDTKLRISGKVKNWRAEGDETVTVSLFLEERQVTSKTLTVGAGNASQVSFLLDQPQTAPQRGWLQIDEDGLALDNRRFFVWKQPLKLDIVLVADPQTDKKWPAAFFLEKSLMHDKRVPWTLTMMTQTELTDKLPGRTVPDLIIAGDLNELTQAGAMTLLRYAREGGKVLLALNERTSPEALNRLLLSELGLRDLGLHYPDPSESRFDVLGRVDFDHPIFFVFRGARFNDFSQLRFMQYHRIEADPPARLLAHFAQFDGSSMPAVIERPLGEGRLMIWTFCPELAWTNLPKHIKFVPFLHETVKYLTEMHRTESNYAVGDTFIPEGGEGGGNWLALTPRGETALAGDAPGLALADAGFVQVKKSGEQVWRFVEAVNPQTLESDPERVGMRELSLKLTSNSSSNDEILTASAAAENITRRHEFGHLFLIFLFLFLVVETWYAAYLSKRQPEFS